MKILLTISFYPIRPAIQLIEFYESETYLIEMDLPVMNNPDMVINAKSGNGQHY